MRANRHTQKKKEERFAGSPISTAPLDPLTNCYRELPESRSKPREETTRLYFASRTSSIHFIPYINLGAYLVSSHRTVEPGKLSTQIKTRERTIPKEITPSKRSSFILLFFFLILLLSFDFVFPVVFLLIDVKNWFKR